MAANNLDLYTRPEYFQAVTKYIQQTKRGDRVAVATMTFDTRQSHIADLMMALGTAAERGVSVHLTIDAYTFLANKGDGFFAGPLWLHTKMPSHLSEPYASWYDTIKELRKSGVHCGISNMPKKRINIIPKGRSHIKGAVINDYVFIGGCNLDNTDQTDIMIGQKHHGLADWVYERFMRLAETQSTLEAFHSTDQTYEIDAISQIIMDSGIAQQSAIYDNALAVIDSATDWIFMTCQYFPGGETATHLYEAHKRGVAIRIIFSHPSAHGPKALIHHAYNFFQRLQLPAEFFIDRRPKDAPKLHAKVLATESAVMVGSHNYVEQGVLFGTAEIALKYVSPAVSNAVVKKITDNL